MDAGRAGQGRAGGDVADGCIVCMSMQDEIDT